MRKVFILSTIAAGVLAFSTLQADSLKDSVANEASKALATGSVKAEAAAKAKVEESQEKLLFKTKMDTSRFKNEALSDKAKMIQHSVSKEAAHHKQNFKQAPKEVISGLDQTIFAIDAIKRNEIEAAKDALDKATKSFDAALKADPKLQLVPVANEITINAFGGDVALIKKTIKTAISLLKDRDTQAARAILLPLQDEMVVTTEFIPMDLYPVATKKAAMALKKGKNDEAVNILITALHMMVSDTIVVPLPLLMAQDLVTAASKLDKSKKKEATAFLKMAQDELEKAVLLGYTKKHAFSYKAIEKEIKAIKKEIKGKNAVEKLYDHIKESFKKLLGETRKDVTRNNAEERVNAFEQKEQKKALHEKTLFKQEATQDTQKTVK